MISILLETAHPTWHDTLKAALLAMNQDYLNNLGNTAFYLPAKEQLLAAFKQPLEQTQYILFGESPYPRAVSANGFAFWDAAVGELWSSTGFSKPVNRATSLRNLLKMLLHARGDLVADFSQPAIARLDTTRYHQTLDDLFQCFLNQGFMLLNASLVYEAQKIPYHARHWAVFQDVLLRTLLEIKPEIKLLLFGKIAEKIKAHILFDSLIAEHPYNISFITNQRVIDFFKPLDLLST